MKFVFLACARQRTYNNNSSREEPAARLQMISLQMAPIGGIMKQNLMKKEKEEMNV